MANNTSNGQNDDGLGFDPIKFANNFYDALEPYRSQFSSQPQQIITSPTQYGQSSSQGEDRLNTFLRLCGFPATRDEDSLFKNKEATLTDKKKKSILSQDDTLNYISGLTSVGGINIKKALSDRETIKQRPVNGDAFNVLLSDPLDIDASIGDTRNRRMALFPLVVDAAVPIYPLERRMAPFFNNGDFLIGGNRTRLSRPFIEQVIYIRAKVLSGFSDPKTLDDLKQNILEVLPSSVFLDSVIGNGNLGGVELTIIEKFIQSIKRLIIEYNKTVQIASRAIIEIKYTPIYTDNPEQQSGSSADISNIEGFVLDEKINDLEKTLREKEALAFILPTNFISRSDRIRRQDAELEIHNINPDIFVSNLTDLLMYETNSIRSNIEDAKNEKRRKVQVIEEVKRDLIYYTGEFGGLSIFDIISVLYALFTVDLKYVISLLNADAKSRFFKDPFFTSNNTTDSIQIFKSAQDIFSGPIDTTPTVESSIIEIQKKVNEAFELGNLFLKDIKDKRPKTKGN